VLNAIGPYAAANFSPDKTAKWASDIEGAVDQPLHALNIEEENSLSDPTSAEQKLGADEGALSEDALVMSEDANAGYGPYHAGNSQAVPTDLVAVKNDISKIYADCGRTAP
jgi:hypothetical protein